jgi:hypothetical protein
VLALHVRAQQPDEARRVLGLSGGRLLGVRHWRTFVAERGHADLLTLFESDRNRSPRWKQS